MVAMRRGEVEVGFFEVLVSVGVSAALAVVFGLVAVVVVGGIFLVPYALLLGEPSDAALGKAAGAIYVLASLCCFVGVLQGFVQNIANGRSWSGGWRLVEPRPALTRAKGLYRRQRGERGERSA
jgi:hypothetical protein